MILLLYTVQPSVIRRKWRRLGLAPERPQQQRGVEDQARVDYRVLVQYCHPAADERADEGRGAWRLEEGTIIVMITAQSTEYH